MVELRPFEGTGKDLESFIVRVWRETYGGKMPVPLWTAEYFDWQFGLRDGCSRDHLIAAYDGNRLVGTSLAMLFQLRIGDMVYPAALSSWLSVDPEYRRQGIASSIMTEQYRIQREQGLPVRIAYTYSGSRFSLGPAFWQSKRKAIPNTSYRAGFWVRVLDGPRVAAWNINRMEGRLTRLLAGWQPAPRAGRSTVNIRPYRSVDLSACIDLIHTTLDRTDFGILWDEKSLDRHLSGGGVGRCLVAERNGVTVGFVSFHCLPFLGRTEEVVGLMDLVSLESMTGPEQASLLDSCLLEMKASGTIMAVKLRTGDHPVIPFVRCGFLPRMPDFDVRLLWMIGRGSLPIIRRLHLLWR